MQHTFGVILKGESTEIFDNEDPTKGHFMGLNDAIKNAEKRITENQKIELVNIYKITQGQRVLAYQLKK